MNLAIRFLRHSILQVTGNFGLALRVSIPMFVVGLIFAAAFSGFLVAEVDVSQDGQLGGLLFVFIIALIFSFMWMAVRFHNEILRPEGAPVSSGENLKRCLGYLGRTILLVLIIIIPFMVTMLLASGLVGVSLTWFFLVTMSIYCVATWVLFRLSPILPAGAIGSPISLGQGWQATRPFSLAIFMLVILWVIIDSVADYFISSLQSPFEFFLTLVINWFLLILGVSLYTTLYGVAVEGRELN